ncbi:MAG TPA: carboxylating nicotinate-nucleotide diphosphorylase [Abditibacteriaceae bacterium]|nr:carboxylating nicotinate-nucleotide diphosphorylase [Abditibacteriaceae bacterium]
MNPTDFVLTPFQIRPLVEAVLREDIRSGDITTNALIPADARATAQMRMRENGVLSGIELARQAFLLLDADARFSQQRADGEHVAAGETVLQIEGTARAVLTAERVALNFVQRMSGIATLTHQFVRETEGTKAVIADTRKTTPGLRVLEKSAVRCGGGSNHRFALDDLVLIKDNHIALCGGIALAIERARKSIGHAVKIEVECDTLEQVRDAADARADILLLDNMNAEQLREAVQIVAGRALCEASGGVNLQTVRGIAQSGVDIISVGALTHGARSLDIGLDIEMKEIAQELNQARTK